jgi:hypothetical protein
MRILLLLIGLIILGCSKHKDPGFTSAEGKWTYTTPDSKIGVTFELVKNGSGLDIQNQTIKVDAVAYQSAGQITGVSLPAIQLVRINANDSKAVFNYNIEFDNGTVSSDFKIISVATATYTWPWGTTNTLTAIKITRP